MFGKEFCDPQFECTSNVFCADTEKCDNHDEDLDCDLITFTCNYADRTFCEEYFKFNTIKQEEEIDSDSDLDEEDVVIDDWLDEDSDENINEDDSTDDDDDHLDAKLNLKVEGEGNDRTAQVTIRLPFIAWLIIVILLLAGLCCFCVFLIYSLKKDKDKGKVDLKLYDSPEKEKGQREVELEESKT